MFNQACKGRVNFAVIANPEDFELEPMGRGCRLEVPNLWLVGIVQTIDQRGKALGMRQHLMQKAEALSQEPIVH
jgi:hypothetical protein